MQRIQTALSALAATVAVLCACNKQDTPDTGLVPVRISYTTSGRFPTKGIADAILATLPESLTLTLTDADGATYTAQTGQEIRLPLGTYSVTGGNNPAVVQYITSSSNRYTTHEPIIRVDDQITISEGVTDYAVEATYGSFAVAVLPSETLLFEATFSGSVKAVDCIKTDDLWLVFVTGNLTGGSSFRPVLTTHSGKVKQFNMYTNAGDTGGIFAEWGKWYILHPQTYQSGVLGAALPEWTAGME